jgi:hypothetical protein
MPIPERSAGREKTSNVTQVGGSEVLDLNTEPFFPGPGCPDPPSTARLPRARSRRRSRSASTGAAGMNPTSTAGLPIPSHGDRNASSMRSDEVCARLLLTAVNRTGLRP